ncbi:MAG: host attachment protein [Rhodospirillaceae bacterium]|nr:host attachment protein [Rhodospirillaceae bacterium]
MGKRKTTWIIVADGSRGRILSNAGPGTGLSLVAEHEAPQARAHTAELGSDRPGRTADSMTPARHAMEPRVDWQRQEKERFVARLAEEIAAARERYDRLVLVAPPRVLGELNRRLDEATRARIVGTLAKDLTWVPLPELAPHLDDVVKL